MARIARLGAAAGGAAEVAEGATVAEVVAGGAEAIGVAGAATLVAGTAGIAALDVGMGKTLLALDGDDVDPLNHAGKRRVRGRGKKDEWVTDPTLPQEHAGTHWEAKGRNSGSWVKDSEPDAPMKLPDVPSWLKSLFGGNSVETNTGRSRPGVAKEVNEAAVLAGQQERWKAQIGKIDESIGQANAKHDTAVVNTLEKQRSDLVAKLDEVIRSLAALNSRPVQVTLDGKPLVAAVNNANGRDARRN